MSNRGSVLLVADDSPHLLMRYAGSSRDLSQTGSELVADADLRPKSDSRLLSVFGEMLQSVDPGLHVFGISHVTDCDTSSATCQRL